jgi:hypothetical protein
MIDFLVRVVGSIIIGWALGASAALVVSRVFYDGGVDQLAFIMVPVTIIVVFLATYGLVPRTR